LSTPRKFLKKKTVTFSQQPNRT
jgi:hypothetical protein